MAYLGQVDRKASNIQVFNVASSTSATHNIGWTPPSEQTIIVTINGVKQHTNAYSFSGAVLTLSSALVTTDELEVIGINDIGNSLTPVDGSVTTSKLGDDAVTLAKMAGLVRGKIIVGDASGDPSALTVGSANQVLKSEGTDAAWAAAGADTSLSNLASAGADKIVKAWVSFDGDPLSIHDSFNVSSITDIGVGIWDINYDTDFANANYAVVAGGSASLGGGDYMQSQNTEMTTAKSRSYAYTGGDGTTWDPNYVSAVAIGDQS